MSLQSPDLALQFRQALRVLRRQAWIVVVCILVAGGVAYELAHRQSVKYEATAQLLIQPYSPDLALANQAAPFVDPIRARATAMQLIDSPTIAAAVMAQVHPHTLDNSISTSASGDSDVISVTARSANQFDAFRLADAFANQYIAFRRQTNQARYLNASRVLEQKLATQRALPAGTTPAARAAHNRALELLRQQGVRLRLIAAAQTGDAQVVQPAEFPFKPLPKNETRDALLGGGFGLLLGLGLAFLRDKLSNRITREDELATLAPGLPVLSYVPSGRGRRWTDAIGDAFNGLSASLDSIATAQTGRAFLVTSPMAEDGKSTTALNLALASTERGQSVLLVDADLRRGILNGKANGDEGSGLASVLAGRQHTSDVVDGASFEPRKNSHGPRIALSGELRLIPAGGRVARPQTMFTQRAVEGLLRDARTMAGTVIIDGPPLGIVADMLPVAKLVDGVLVVVRLGHTRPRALTRLLEQLEAAGTKPVGIVLIGADANEYYR